MRILSGRETCAILAAQGFIQVRQRGSHIVMQRVDGTSTRTVAVPNHAELRTGPLLSVVRQSGLSRSLFEV